MQIKQVPAHPNNYRKTSTIKKGIVFHWIVGTLESAGRSFANPNRGASAHYSIGDKDIHQHVPEKYKAIHAGNYQANTDYIGIEHEGGWLIGGSNRYTPSQQTLDTSVELCVDICKRWKIPKLVRGENAFKHNEVSDRYTECCGTLDIDYIVNKTNQILNNNNMSFKFKIERKGGNQYLVATQGDYRGAGQARNLTKNTSWSFTRTDSNDWDAPVNNGYHKGDKYEFSLGGYKVIDDTSDEIAKPPVDPVDPCKSVKAELKEKTDQLADKIREYNDLKVQYRKVQDEKEVLRVANEEVNTKLKQKEVRIGVLEEEQKEELERQAKGYEEEIENLKKANKRLQDELEEGFPDCSEYQRKTAELAVEITRLKGEIKILEAKLEENNTGFEFPKFLKGLSKYGWIQTILVNGIGALVSYLISVIPELEPYRQEMILFITGTFGLGSVVATYNQGQKQVEKEKNK